MRSPLVLARAASALLAALACGACGASGAPLAPTGSEPPAAIPDETPGASPALPSTGAARAPGPAELSPYAGPVGGARPTYVHVPPSYRSDTPAPLVVMLHGYSGTGALEELYLHLTDASDARGFLYVHPDGTKDIYGFHFWNATDACCNFGGSSVDDSGYLSALIDEIESIYNVDPTRVYVVGHSNGGFMAHRFACDHADQIAAVVSFGGAMLEDVSKCTPKEPVAALEIHGTADEAIAYEGGANGAHPYPAAPTTVADWASLEACSPAVDTSAPPLDLDALVDGPETTITRYLGCASGGHAELWTVHGGTHIPLLAPGFAGHVADFLYAHPKR